MDFYQDLLPKIKNMDLLVQSEYELDEWVLHYFNNGSIGTEEVIIEKPKAERYYFNLSIYDDIQKTPITKEEYNNEPIQNILLHNGEGNFSTLNYEQLIPKFQVQDGNEYFYPYIDEHLLWEMLDSINNILHEVKNQDVFFNNFLEQLEVSNGFLRKFLEKCENPVQKLFAENFISFNENLYRYLKQKFNNITDIFRKIDEQGFIPSFDFPKDEGLRSSNIYKIAVLFAKGRIKREKTKYFYDNEEYESVNKLSNAVAIHLSLPKNSVQPYLNSTLSEIDNDKDIFSLSKLKYLRLIKQDNEDLSPSFYQRLKELEEENERM